MGILPAEELPRYLRYNSGKLFWLPRTPDMFTKGKRSREWRCNQWNSCCADKQAFTSVNDKGYLHGTLLGRSYLAHRVVWGLVKGDWPKTLLDHINGDSLDNSVENLREVSHSLNSRNTKMRSDNISGVTGVYWSNSKGRWVVEAHNKYFGSFESLSEAVGARKTISEEHGYTSRHGEV